MSIFRAHNSDRLSTKKRQPRWRIFLLRSWYTSQWTLLPQQQSISRLQNPVAENALTEVEYFPFSQLVQVATDVAPSLIEIFLAAQLRHTVAMEAPTEVEYVPVPQSIQVATDVAPPVVDYFPATQSWHVAVALAPTEVEYSRPANGACCHRYGSLTR